MSSIIIITDHDKENDSELSTPPAKKTRRELDEECSFWNDKCQLQEEWVKSKPRISTLKQLMDATYKKRRGWITGCCPSASEVLQEYPCFKSGKIVSIHCTMHY